MQTLTAKSPASTTESAPDRLSWWTGQFADARFEQDFLQTQSRDLNRRLVACALILIFISVLRLPMDWTEGGLPTVVRIILTVMRVLGVGGGLAILWVSKQRRLSPTVVHNSVLFVALTLLLGLSIPIAIFPYDPVILAGWNAAFFLFIALLTPVSALGRNILFFILVGRFVLDLALHDLPPHSDTGSALMVFGLAVGHFGAVFYGRRQRREFSLLFRTFPIQVVQRMMEGEAVHDQAESASVLFADLVGFTSWSTKRSSMEVVTALDALFSSFDQLASQHGVEPIKTIGDCYMAACGVPDPDPCHAERLAKLALDMQQVIAKTSAFGQPMQLRIGIHSGPLAAGVIHCRRQTYDLWGDTVNVAERLQSNAEAGSTWISQVTAEALPLHFVTTLHGEVALKGLGTVTVFVLREEATSHVTDSPPENAESP